MIDHMLLKAWHIPLTKLTMDCSYISSSQLDYAQSELTEQG